MKHIKMDSIEQFKNVIVNLKHDLLFNGYDENGKATFKTNVKMPTICFEGTVKVHGTQASIVYNDRDKLYFESKKNIITPLKDNNGFAFFAEARKKEIMKIITKVKRHYGIKTDEYSIVINGEFFGGNIQKGIGVSKLQKKYVIFGLIAVPFDNTKEILNLGVKRQYTEDTYRKEPLKDIYVLELKEKDIYNIYFFKTFKIWIDFEHPEISQNEITKLVKEVEDDCPVARYFLPETKEELIGEGIVFRGYYINKEYVFKAKGDKHSNSKVKTLKTIDLKKLSKIEKCVEEISHIWRFEQGLKEIFPDGNIDIKKIGSFIKWINNDTIKEEMLTIVEYGFEFKEIVPVLTRKTKEYFFEAQKASLKNI